MFTYYYDTPIGKMGITEKDNAISNVFLADKNSTLAELQETSLIKEAHSQLDAYFKGKLHDFSLPLNPDGTAFQKQVWTALCQIPYGKTQSYGETANAIGKPKAARAIGMANHNNPIMIIIPCHRVIGKNGKLVGYGGGIDIKEKLLALESGSIIL